MNSAPISIDLFGAEMRLRGSEDACEYAWHTKSAQVLAFLLCHGNECDWVNLLTSVWGDATQAARASYHTLQSSLNKRMRELHAFDDNPLAVVGDKASLSDQIQEAHGLLIKHFVSGNLTTLDHETQMQLRNCDPEAFLAGIDEYWANRLRRNLQEAHMRLVHPIWDGIVVHAGQLHGGQVRHLIEAAKHELTFVFMDANELFLSCERALLAALERGVKVRFLVFDVEAGVKPDDARHNMMLDEVGLSRCVTGMQAMVKFRKKWTGDPARLSMQLYPWTPLSRIYLMDGNTADGKVIIVPYLPTRHSPEVPAFCLSWKSAYDACKEYSHAVDEMFTNPALRNLSS